MEIRQCKEEDLPQVAELVAEYCDEIGKKWHLPSIEATLAEQFQLECSEHYVVQVDGKIVAGISYVFINDPYDDELLCQKLHWFVKKEHRGTVGKTLLKLMDRDWET